MPALPLIVQSDHTLLLEVENPAYEEARDALLAFAELVKSPEYVHTWRITPLSLWNAAAAGHSADEVLAALQRYAKYPIPPNIPQSIRASMARYGTLRLLRDGDWLRLEADDPATLVEIRHLQPVEGLLGEETDAHGIRVLPRRWEGGATGPRT